MSSLSSLLIESGYDVNTAISGPEGLHKAKIHKPDLILLDIMMPKMDGYQVLSELKKDPTTSSIPVVMFTAKAEANSIWRAQELRATDYLLKPFTGEQLIRYIRRYIY